MREASHKDRKDKCEFFFEAYEPDQPSLPSDSARERIRRSRYIDFLEREAGALLVSFPFRRPDLEPLEESSELFGLLLYHGRRSRARKIRVVDGIAFVYETAYAWSWEYGSDEFQTLSQLERVVVYLRAVTTRVRERDIGRHRETLDLIPPSEAKALGLVL